MKDNERKINVWLPLLFAMVMIIGMVLGFNLRDTLRYKRAIQTVVERNDRLEQIIDLIKEKYVDSVDVNLLYKDAISGIVSHLDPHTVYIPADELQAVNEDLEGSFFGIGVEFNIVNDTIQVTAVIEGGPAERVGVEIGDQLIKVGDSTVAGTHITSQRIIKMLRGAQHTKVPIMLNEPGTQRLKRVMIARDAIPIYSVEANVMLDATTGYIRINRFSATTYEEFVKALKILKAKGAKQLILDLRHNPGGYLDAATKIADELIKDNKLLVYTQGNKSARKDYIAEEPGMMENGRVIVLVDEGSASASEVLAGAIQDLDRGVVIGRRSYGKGLVQEQFDLEDGAALRLTIARYYTPSGRSIQRTYAKGRAAYADAYEERLAHLDTMNDTLQTKNATNFFTANHRPVYSGGGIKPDVIVAADTIKLNAAVANLMFGEQFKKSFWAYYLKNRLALRQYKTVEDFDAHFSTNGLMNVFTSMLPASKRIQLQSLMKQEQVRKYIDLQMKAQLARVLFRNNGFYTIHVKGDVMVQKALQIIHANTYNKLIEPAMKPTK